MAEKVKFVPLYVHDGTQQKEDGSYTGTFDITTNEQHVQGSKWIADVKPYGGNFSTYEEAQAYAKLFAAAPDLLKELRLYVIQCRCHNHASGEINFNSVCHLCVSAVQTIKKATL